MLTVHLSCPCCSHNLRSHRPIAPGQTVRCPHCGSSFRAGCSSTSESRRGAGILLAWLLFANLLLLAVGGIALVAAIGKRERPQDAMAMGGASEPRPSGSGVDSPVREKINQDRSLTVAAPTRIDPPPAPPSKPAAAPDARPNPPADPPKPPPLPEPPRRSPQPPPPTKERPAEPEPPRAPKRHETPQVHWLPAPIQNQVDRSIDRGVEFLRRRQRSDGSWGHQTGVAAKRFTPGISALCALTLLECGVSAEDGQVNSTARYLRQRMPELTSTYSIAMTILFFDRLGQQADAPRIRTLALRLLAGQKPSGGWDYYCPMLSPDDELGLLALLYKDRPTSPLDLFVQERKPEGERLDSDLYRPRPSKVPPLELFITEDRSPPSAIRHLPGAQENGEPRKRETEERKAESGMRGADLALPGDTRRLSPHALEAAGKLPEALRRTPALHTAELLRQAPDLHQPRTDNSNTQFAILGLLTAENYDVPMERAMSLIDWRFRNSMTGQDGWNYRPSWQTTPSMTAAALMGLALKHGLLLPNRRGRGRDVVVHDDEILHRGFVTLTAMLDQYYAGFVFGRQPLDNLDLYCLWTVERVAVLYNLRTMGSLDWYPAGVELLLPLQREDGSWSPEGTNCLKEPSVASSFALLFLKRSNLARGLSERIAPADDR